MSCKIELIDKDVVLCVQLYIISVFVIGAVCTNDPQFPITLACDDVYCFLCLKDHVLKSGETFDCVTCKKSVTVDLNHVSRDLRNLISNLKGEFVWLYRSVSGDGYWMFDPNTTTKIDNFYKSKLPLCTYRIGSKMYKMKFGNEEGEQIYESMPNDPNPKRRYVKRIVCDENELKRLNVKGISGIFFKKIEQEIGKFVI